MIKYQNTFKDTTPANYDGLFDWDFLLPAFKKTKIQPMDIDAVIERKGHILIFETKNIGVTIPLGQKITLETFIKLGKGKITIFILYGKTPKTIDNMEIWVYKQNTISKLKIKCDYQIVLYLTTEWFKMINKKIYEK